LDGFWKILFPLDIAKILGFMLNLMSLLLWYQNPDLLADSKLPKLEKLPSLWAGLASADAVHAACWVRRWLRVDERG